MKKLLLLLVAFATISLTAQVTVFEEDFDGSGSGFATWTAIDVDGFAPNENPENPYSALVGTQGWALLDFTTEVFPAISAAGFDQLDIIGNVIGAHSWYEPVGQSNDWAISPAIDLTAASGLIELKWDALSIAGNPNFNEDYVVKISTTGDAMADFTTDLLDVTLETNASPTTHTVDLSSYAGETVYLAFVDDSNDRWGVVVDNIIIQAEAVAATDDLESVGFSFSPNPASDFLNMRANTAINEVIFYNILGEKVLQVLPNSLESSIDISKLSSGAYFVQAQVGDSKGTFKVVKK